MLDDARPARASRGCGRPRPRRSRHRPAARAPRRSAARRRGRAPRAAAAARRRPAVPARAPAPAPTRCRARRARGRCALWTSLAAATVPYCDLCAPRRAGWYRHPRDRSQPRLLHQAPRGSRSRHRQGARGRGAAPGDDAGDDRLRELRPAGDPRLPGLGAHQQVRRGLPGQALLRRLRARGRGREPGHRAREGAVRRRARERAAARRRPGQRRRLPRAAGPRRPHPGHEARPRRPSHPRDEDQLLGQALRHRRLRRARGGLAPRHGRAPAARRRVQAQADPRPAGRPTRASSTSSASARSPTRSAPC